MSDLTGLVASFAELLRPREGNSQHLDEWIAAVRHVDLPHLHAFTGGLDFDRDAVHAAVTLPYHNGGTEGVNTKTKRIMRQMYGEPASPCFATASCSADSLWGISCQVRLDRGLTLVGGSLVGKVASSVRASRV